MKKSYFLIAFLFLAITANAQVEDFEFTDDMESYDLGPLFEGRWSTWHGVPSDENIIISTEQAASGTQSGFIGPGPQGPQDALLLLGNITEGIWLLNFNMFIPVGSSGYFNIQGETDGLGATNPGFGVFNSGDIDFRDGFVIDTNLLDGDPQILPYPSGEWFPVQILFDLETGPRPTYTLFINDLPMEAVQFSSNDQENSGDETIGALDFFAVLGNHTNFVDDFVFQNAANLATDDFRNDNFNIFPNPVVDNLNIESTEAVSRVTVYDVLGKEVLTTTPGIASPSIDMSNMTSGVYLVNITTANSSKTIKVLK